MSKEILRLQQLAEITVNKPGGINKVSLDTFKKALYNECKIIFEELEFENIDEDLNDLTNTVLKQNNFISLINSLLSYLDDLGFEPDRQSIKLLGKIFIR